MTALTFTDLPTWTLQGKPGVLSFFESIALADLEGKWIRLSARMQRLLLGSVVFGKQSVCVTPEGEVLVQRSTCFGMDREIGSYGLYEIKSAVAIGKQLSPGIYGGRYWDLGIQQTMDALRGADLVDAARALRNARDWKGLNRLLCDIGIRTSSNTVDSALEALAL